MKKTITLLVALVMCLSLCACGGGNDEKTPAANETPAVNPGSNGANSESKDDEIPSVDSAAILKEGACGSTATFKLYDNGVLVISGSGSIDRDSPFKSYNDYIKFVRIEEGITEIAVGAFKDLDSFSVVELPTTLKKIGSNAFNGCFKLKYINFPDGLEYIGEGAFGITSIKELYLPDSLTKIENHTFSHNDDLEFVYIPGSVKMIGEFVFSGCDSLEVIILGEGVERIGSNSFDFKGSPKIAIPDSLVSCGYDNIDYRKTVYCNEGSVAAALFPEYVDVIVGYDGFVKNYDIP